MKTLTLNPANGDLSIGGTVVSGLDRTRFDQANRTLGLEDTTRNPSHPTFGTPVSFVGEPFALTLDFDGDRQKAIWLLWEAGNAGTKGYDCSEADLIADKKALSKRLAKAFPQASLAATYNHDVLTFPWGTVTVAAFIQSMMVTVAIAPA